MARIAFLVAHLRGTINVWKNNSEDKDFDHTIPLVEKPDRINQAFYNLARGHAVACRRDYLNDDDLRIVIKVALSSASFDRARLFRLLLRHGGILSTEDVIHGISCSRPTALKQLEMLQCLGLVRDITSQDKSRGHSEKKVNLDDKFSWFIGSRFRSLME